MICCENIMYVTFLEKRMILESIVTQIFVGQKQNSIVFLCGFFCQSLQAFCTPIHQQHPWGDTQQLTYASRNYLLPSYPPSK